MNDLSPDMLTIFTEAISLDSDVERQRFLDEACNSHPSMRERIESLIHVHFEEKRFLGGSSPSIETRDQQPGDQIDEFTIREQIGEGGMGIVYVAEQTDPIRRKVALKIIKPGMATKEVVARFEAERQALAMMDHANIARVFDGGVTDRGQPYFVMELVQGLPIGEYCDRERLDVEARLRIFSKVCRAIHHAHQKGIIHRDLKPSNVLVSQIDNEVVPKVIDFGIAKAVDQKLTEQPVYTRISQLVGTPVYMSPEQTELGVVDVDTRSDVYSLGVLLYELLTGNLPFERKTLDSVGFDEMRRIIREEEPARPSTLISTLSSDAAATVTDQRRTQRRKLKDVLAGELDWLVMKALEKDRDRRYESANLMAEDIDRYLRQEPIVARPPSTVYRWSKFVQRNKARLIPVAIVATVLMVGLVAALTLALKERAEKESARFELEDLQANTARRLYASQMVQASTAWEARDYGALQKMLQSTTPQSADSPDFRDWEWHFLSDQARRPFVAIPKTHALQASWNPQSNEIAVIVASKEKTSAVEIWQPGSVSPIRTLTELSSPNPWWTTMTWSGSGNHLAVGIHEEGRVVVVHGKTGETLFDKRVHQGAVRGIALSPDGDILATGNHKGLIQLWGVATGQLRKVLFDPVEKQNLNCLAFSPDGLHLAATLRYGQRVVWENLDTDATIDFVRVSDGSDGVVAWSEDGERLVATDKHTIAVYQLQNSNPIAEFTHRGVSDACWIDEFRLASCGADQTVRIWNWKTGEMLRSFRFGQSSLETLDVSPDRTMIATRGPSGLIVAQLAAQEYDVFQSDIRDGRRSLVRWSNDGSRIALRYSSQVGKDSSEHRIFLRILDLPISRFVVGHDDVSFGWVLYWSQDDTQILGFGYDRNHPDLRIHYSNGVTVPDFEPGITLQPDGQVFHGLALNQELGLLAVAVCNAEQKEVRIYDTVSLEIQHRLPLPAIAFQHTTQLEWSPNHQMLFVWCSIESAMDAQVYDVQNRQITKLRPIEDSVSFEVSTTPTEIFDWDPTSTQIAVGLKSGVIRIWDVKSGQRHAVAMQHSAPVNEISWSPSGRRIASCTADGTIHLWDAERGDRLATFHPPTKKSLFESVQWSPDGRRLAIGGSDGEIYIMDAGPSMSPQP